MKLRTSRSLIHIVGLKQRRAMQPFCGFPRNGAFKFLETGRLTDDADMLRHSGLLLKRLGVAAELLLFLMTSSRNIEGLIR
jgi:hypothetical protein